MFSVERIIKKTRKEHRCGLCRKTVPKGSQIQYFFTSDPHDGVNYGRNCMECVDFVAKHPEIFDDDNFISENDLIEFMIDEGYLKRK